MNMPSPQNPGVLNWTLLIGLGVVWGAAFLSVRIGLDGFGPFTVAALRVSIGAIVLVVLAEILGQSVRSIPNTRALKFVAAIGLGATALPFLLLSWGQQFVPSAFAGVAMGAVPLMLLPLVYIFSPEEGIGPRRIIGFGLGFVGLAILIGPGAIENTGDPLQMWGRLSCLGAPLCYAVGSVTTRRAPAMPPLAFAAGGLIFASLALVPLALIIEGWPQNWPTRPFLGVLYAALLPTALAAVIRVRIITTAGSLFMSMVSYMVPVWSVILGVTLMGEGLPAQLYVALAIILIGILLSQWRALITAVRTTR